MLGELVWMARVLRYGRDTVSSSDASTALTCSACGTAMNQHAEKVDFSSPNAADPVFYGTVQEIHHCRGCGNVQTRPAVDMQ
jgi:ribosomal protein S27E